MSMQLHSLNTTQKLAAALAVIVLTFTPLAGASAARPEQWFRIVHVQTGKSMDVLNSSKNNGAILGLFDYHGGNNQQFRMEAGRKGYYFVNRSSGKPFAVANASQQAGMPIFQWEKGTGSNDQFRLEHTESGNFYIIALHSNKPITTSSWKLVQGDRRDAKAEFRLMPVNSRPGNARQPARPAQPAQNATPARRRNQPLIDYAEWTVEGRQKAGVSLTVTPKVTRTADGGRHLHINMMGTEVHAAKAGSMVSDTVFNRAWFLKQVTTIIEPMDPAVKLVAKAVFTRANNGSVTTSRTNTVGVQGGVATSGPSAGVSMSQSRGVANQEDLFGFSADASDTGVNRAGHYYAANI